MPLESLVFAAALAVAAIPSAGKAVGHTLAPGTVAFVVTIEVKPGAEARFLELLGPVLDAMRHEATFVNAILHRDPENPSRFMI